METRLTELYDQADHSCCRGEACHTPLQCGLRSHYKTLASFHLASKCLHTSFGMYVLAFRGSLEQDVQHCRRSCIHGISVADAANIVSLSDCGSHNGYARLLCSHGRGDLVDHKGNTAYIWLAPSNRELSCTSSAPLLRHARSSRVLVDISSSYGQVHCTAY